MERKFFINSKVGFCSVVHPSWRGLLALLSFCLSLWFLGWIAGVYPSSSEVIKGYIYIFSFSHILFKILVSLFPSVEDSFHFLGQSILGTTLSCGSRVRGQTQRHVSDLDQD